MPITIGDGSTTYPIGIIYANNGTANYTIGEIYANNGSGNNLVYKRSESGVMTVSGIQGINTTIYSTFIWPKGYTTFTIDSITPAQSFGVSITEVYHYDGTNFVTLRKINRSYTGVGHTWSELVTPQNTYTRAAGINEICLKIDVTYDPNVSGPLESTATLNYTLS